MATGRTRRIQFSRIRFSSPTRRGPYSEDPDVPNPDMSSSDKSNDDGCWETFKAFWSCSKPGYFWINWFAILRHLINDIPPTPFSYHFYIEIVVFYISLYSLEYP